MTDEVHASTTAGSAPEGQPATREQPVVAEGAAVAVPEAEAPALEPAPGAAAVAVPVPAEPPTSGSTDGPPSSPSEAVAAASSAFERPEVQLGAAFAGGLLAALILKRLAS